MNRPTARAPEGDSERTMEGAAPESDGSAGEPVAPELEPAEGDPTAALAQEAAEVKDRWLRALAEMENLRRRTEREVADTRSYAISSFARDLLGVADNMRRALDAFDAEHRQSADPGTKALIEGVELTERELLKTLEKHGVRKLDPQGTKFDPHRHQAMYEVPDASVPSGTVVQVVQPGYTIGERVLRPALVAVSKGGPKAARASAEAPGESANDNAASDEFPDGS
jgi:molecular chaperone GrpE